MKAWLLDRIGSLDDLRLADDAPEPELAAGEVLLEVDHAALNPADRYLAEGQYPARPVFPHILGRDGVGRVLAMGPGVEASQVRVGDRRLILRTEIGVNRPGTFAQRVAVNADSLAAIPEGWTDEQAAGAALVYLTAWQALTMWEENHAAVDDAGDAKRGVLLITGASGGVGTACVHLGRALGYEIVALSRSSEKAARLREQGADHTMDPAEEGWPRKLKSLLAGRRVNLAVDNIGGPGFNQVLDVLGEQGRVSCVGALAGPVPMFNTPGLFFRRARIGGVMVGSYSAAEAQAAWREVVAAMKRLGARPLVDSVWEFEDLRGAFERLQAGPMGKVLLRC